MNQNILNEYQIKETIGKGTFSKVKLGINKSTGEKVAIKILDKRKIKTNSDRIRVQRELTILKKINHINIVKIIQTKEDQENVYIVMEFIDYDLFLHIVNNKRLEEKEAALYFFQLISGLEYIHSLNIVHRDLKPENLLLTKRRVLKIIDFGLSNFFFGEELLLTPCGSPSYTPPEMIKGYKYNGFAVDIWTTGIILYGMLCGYLPFEEKDTKSLFKKIIKCKVIYPKYVSNNAQNLLRRILVSNPDKRITINEIKKQPFYLEGKDIFYKRYPDLVDKLENGNNTKLNKNYSFNATNNNNNPPKDINDISIKNFSSAEKKQISINENDDENYDYYKKLKEKSSSPYSLYKKHLKNKANFEILKKILRGSRTDSLETEINPLMNDENENEDDKNLKMKMKGEENVNLKSSRSPIQLIRRLNNQRQKYEKRLQMTETKDKNGCFKPKIKIENNYDTLNYEDEKNNNLNKENQRINKTNIFNLNNNEIYNKKNNSKDNQFLLMNNRVKYRNYNTIKDEEKNVSSSNNLYKDYNYYNKNNNNFKFKFNNHKYSFSLIGNNESTSEYFDSFNEYNKNSIKMKSYIINNSMNDNKCINNKSINNKSKKTKSPSHSKYSGLSEKIISFNILYNSIQNKIESYRENHERKNKYDKINDQNSEIVNKTNSIDKKNIKTIGKKYKKIKMNIKSAEHRRKAKKIRQENNFKYTPSDLNKLLKTLKYSKNNSKNNVRSLENYALRDQYPDINNNKNNNSMSKRNKNTEKYFKKHNHNQKRINPISIDGKKYDIMEIIKRRGLNKNYMSENHKY